LLVAPNEIEPASRRAGKGFALGGKGNIRFTENTAVNRRALEKRISEELAPDIRDAV
jgi:hypothetical protein